MCDKNVQIEEQMDQLPYQNLKCINQCTTISFKHKKSYQSAIFDLQSFTHPSTDNSFEQAIHSQNVQILKNATIKYLEESIDEPFNKNEGFKDVSLYECPPFQLPTGNQFEIITLDNPLLSEKQKQEMVNILKEEEELIGYLKELTAVFGVTIGKELTYIIYHILKQKLKQFQRMKSPKESILPRFECFNGFDELQKMLTTSCEIYEDLNVQQIPQFAEKGLEDLSSLLYYSSLAKVLTLRQIKYDAKCKVFPTKFTNLIKSISRNLFYSLAGSVEPVQSGSLFFSLDMCREVSFSEFTEGNILSIQRSISRPFVSCDEEQLDFLSKKLKFDKS